MFFYRVNMTHKIDTILAKYKLLLGKDFSVYRNHAKRIYNFMILLDKDTANYEKYAIACVFHDIGIWTDSFDYLEPSIKLATAYLQKSKQENWIEEISLMIDYHHKISTYVGKHKKTVEVFRKADWIDVSMGILLNGVKKYDYRAIVQEFPNTGFHLFLVKQSLQYFPKNPLNPLPMLRR